jgi:hypothetical protein
MDLKVSRREQRAQPDGPVDVLIDNTCELYPLFDDDDPDLIVDVEFLDDPRQELLDRAMFALVKQRGLDPLAPLDGVQWAEHIVGEVSAPVILHQIAAAVSREGAGVRVTPSAMQRGGVSYTTFKIELV